MQIPEYIILATYNHLKRIVDNAKCERADTRTANAIRLARTDLKRLEKYVIKTNTKN